MACGRHARCCFRSGWALPSAIVNKPESIRRWLSPGSPSVRGSRYPALFALALDGLDAKLEQHLDSTGLFVEAGANDGLTRATPTISSVGGDGAHLDRGDSRAGRPMPAQPAARRRGSRRALPAGPPMPAVMHYPFDVGGGRGVGRSGNGRSMSGADWPRRIWPKPTKYEYRRGRLLRCSTKPLRAGDRLLSLDVEGMEADVLRGLDFARYAPRFICVEARNRPAIEACWWALPAGRHAGGSRRATRPPVWPLRPRLRELPCLRPELRVAVTPRRSSHHEFALSTRCAARLQSAGANPPSA